MIYFLQSIVEKMKRHILAITSIEDTVEGEDAGETQSLLQAQDHQHRTTQRFRRKIFLTAFMTKQ